ncbi:hypothetical protein [Umezawaea sp. Da 62-37]|uniref:hypothetical protein n=1 Tax=Umezawaea sp. Da 62-37 TaxID=3075927 RepID=UPI0028F6E11D|nr:hypothetical protein [Umezawaea sp. Da 62-37]WNV81914.1 hypothetical protein RM788_27240 [Umezawaea sp. Da 62-37]
MGRAEQKSRLAVVVALATGLGLAAAGCSAGQITQTDTQVAAVNGSSGQVGSIAVRDAQFAFPTSGKWYESGDDAGVVVVVVNNGTTADKLLSVTSEIATAPAELSGDVDLEPQTSIASLFADLDRSSTSASPSVTKTSTPSGSSSVAPSGSSSSAAASSAASSSTVESSGSSSSSSAAVTGTSTAGSSAASSAAGASSSAPSSSSAAAEPGKVTITLKKLAKELRPGNTVKVTFLFEKAGPLTLELPIGADPEPRAEGKSEH